MKKDRHPIKVGRILSSHLKDNLIQGETLAGLIGKQGQTVSLYRNSPDIRTNTLEDICYALKHNFFQDIANHLPREFSVSPRYNAENLSIIAQLQEENKVLKIQNELLMRLKG